MDLSLFLAKLIGLYMLIIAAVWVIRKDQVDLGIRDFLSSRGLILFSGAINIIAGLAIAIGHPIWQMNWRGLLTLIAYIMIFQGVMRFAFIDEVQRNAQAIARKGYWPVIVVLLLLGGFLTYSGFTG